MNRKYELVVIVSAALTPQEKEAVLKEASDIIGKHEGKVINSKVWLEKHKMTFPIKKVSEGTYFLLNFEGDGSRVSQLREALKMNEKILRSTIVTQASSN